ncbi:MAG: S-methyl-5'-thioadenosine phosphorylase, partial [Planctomycetes bacterium]|nr:S-methyl-5'-thioadenosine phosphorylase [Planctomycetota bacterium]
IGMTNLQEAKLAREAEIAYSTIALATDYDCWHEAEADVNVADVIAVLHANVDRAKQVIDHAARLIAEGERISCDGFMEHAIMTAHDQITPDARRRLELLIGRYIG